MKSNGFSDRLDLNRDLPTTPDDVAALRRARVAPPMTLEEYFRFLTVFRSASREEPHVPRGPGEPVPFEISG